MINKLRPSGRAMSLSCSAARRLLRELEAWNSVESREEWGGGIERLGPAREHDLFVWEAVINGRGVGAGYDAGRWLLRILVPPTYPLQPPMIAFATPVVHPNVALDTGAVCLDLLLARPADGSAWTPAYTILECVRAVRLLLSCPGLDSPLNVDVAMLLRGGDAVGAQRLVELWVDERKYEGR